MGSNPVLPIRINSDRERMPESFDNLMVLCERVTKHNRDKERLSRKKMWRGLSSKEASWLEFCLVRQHLLWVNTLNWIEDGHQAVMQVRVPICSN